MNEDAGSTLQKCPTYNNAVENEKGDLSLSLLLQHYIVLVIFPQMIIKRICSTYYNILNTSI